MYVWTLYVHAPFLNVRWTTPRVSRASARALDATSLMSILITHHVVRPSLHGLIPLAWLNPPFSPLPPRFILDQQDRHLNNSFAPPFSLISSHPPITHSAGPFSPLPTTALPPFPHLISFDVHPPFRSLSASANPFAAEWRATLRRLNTFLACMMCILLYTSGDSQF